jgi:peptidoglycan/LPS O-acetylase OafA/YrhL
MRIPQLRRVTSTGAYIPEIDGLRFIAIMSVVCFHTLRMTEIYTNVKYKAPSSMIAAFFGGMLDHGYRGVSLFFAISGFVLGLPFARHYLAGGKAVKLKDYFLRRVTRLEPPYIANLLIRLPFTPAAHHLTWAAVVPHFLASLIYCHTLIYDHEPIVHGPSWSLEVEVQFYLLAPLFAMLFFRGHRFLRYICFLAVIIGAGFLQLHRPDGVRWELNIINFGQYFLAGFLVADFYITLLPNLRRSILWDVVCAPLWCFVFLGQEKITHIWVPLITVLLYCGAFQGVVIRWFLRRTWVATIGGMCYSIYLTHSMVLQGAYRVFSKLPIHGWWTKIVVSEILIVPILLSIGTVFFVLIERPCMDKNWPQKLVARFRRTPEMEETWV